MERIRSDWLAGIEIIYFDVSYQGNIRDRIQLITIKSLVPSVT